MLVLLTDHTDVWLQTKILLLFVDQEVKKLTKKYFQIYAAYKHHGTVVNSEVECLMRV